MELKDFKDFHCLLVKGTPLGEIYMGMRILSNIHVQILMKFHYVQLHDGSINHSIWQEVNWQ